MIQGSPQNIYKFKEHLTSINSSKNKFTAYSKLRTIYWEFITYVKVKCTITITKDGREGKTESIST